MSSDYFDCYLNNSDSVPYIDKVMTIAESEFHLSRLGRELRDLKDEAFNHHQIQEMYLSAANEGHGFFSSILGYGQTQRQQESFDAQVHRQKKVDLDLRIDDITKLHKKVTDEKETAEKELLSCLAPRPDKADTIRDHAKFAHCAVLKEVEPQAFACVDALGRMLMRTPNFFLDSRLTLEMQNSIFSRNLTEEVKMVLSTHFNKTQEEMIHELHNDSTQLSSMVIWELFEKIDDTIIQASRQNDNAVKDLLRWVVCRKLPAQALNHLQRAVVDTASAGSVGC